MDTKSKTRAIEDSYRLRLRQGIKKGLIQLDESANTLTYIHENIRRNYNNPEELIEVDTFLRIILTYRYPVKRVRLFVPVTMGSDKREADIVVYNDDECKQPFIVVECKRQEVSEAELIQAVNQGFSYAYALAGTIKYLWVTSGLKNQYYRVDKDKKDHHSVPDIPQFGVQELAEFKFAKDGGEYKGQKLFGLEPVTESELTRRFKQAHQALWGGGELNPSTAFDELDKLIFCKIWDEKKTRKSGEPYDFQVIIKGNEQDTNTSLLQRIKALYNEGRERDPEVFKDDIRLDSSKLRTVVGYLEGVNIGETDLDSKGRAFESFMGSYFRGDFGQYFTPRSIVDFIVKVLPIKNTSLVLDTSCGSGGFLLHALDKVRKQAKEYYKENSVEFYKYWHDFAQSNLYGIEINEQIARTAKMNMIIHDDGHTNVVASDGLLSDKMLRECTKNQGFQYNRFDFIITNPPFGSSIKQSEKPYYTQYRMVEKEIDWLNPTSKAGTRPAQSTEVLFIEQCYYYLKENGYLAIVIPDGILTNSTLQYVRDNIEEMYRIVAVISLPQTAFTHTGAGVKSSVLFLRKHPQSMTDRIRKTKDDLKTLIIQDQNYRDAYARILRTRDRHVKELKDFVPSGVVSKAELMGTDEYKEWKSGIMAQYAEQIEELKEKMTDLYDERRRRSLASPEMDYRIFMAIVEDVGYDATGRPTGKSELDDVVAELSRFIDAIEKDEE